MGSQSRLIPPLFQIIRQDEGFLNCVAILLFFNSVHLKLCIREKSNPNPFRCNCLPSVYQILPQLYMDMMKKNPGERKRETKSEINVPRSGLYRGQGTEHCLLWKFHCRRNFKTWPRLCLSLGLSGAAPLASRSLLARV